MRQYERKFYLTLDTKTLFHYFKLLFMVIFYGSLDVTAKLKGSSVPLFEFSCMLCNSSFILIILQILRIIWI